MNETHDKSASDHAWDELIGPFLDEVGVETLLHASTDFVTQRVDNGEIICTVTEDSTKLYPTFQFGPSGELLPHLADVLAVLRQEEEDDWGLALWLNAPVRAFGGRSATALLREGRADQVIEVAVHDAHRWSQ